MPVVRHSQRATSVITAMSQGLNLDECVLGAKSVEDVKNCMLQDSAQQEASPLSHLGECILDADNEFEMEACKALDGKHTQLSLCLHEGKMSVDECILLSDSGDEHSYG